ncbi:hypothetical protein [Brucella pseudogrignonensis]|uniref:Uncharacterized protein n=1 Tax=Brucella pseudogrignonensis TaxID=419475 RepID=A0ABU1M4M2_9HYPH|nr:hypothetical protein [Brucella pseudogrignonensis]MDR6430988.1 hypothetical protein [Brucella pseudogrignonensis]
MSEQAQRAGAPIFTPGPWAVGYNHYDVGVKDNAKTGGYTKLFDVRGWGYLTGTGHGGLGLKEDEAIAIQNANACLAAAAPELYEALEYALNEVSAEKYLRDNRHLLTLCRAALAKARGAA